ncbi:predicted protein [Postia placenta Mad-698-R]|nr:predicted protein [Postia placenta Mad-698-R]
MTSSIHDRLFGARIPTGKTRNVLHGDRCGRTQGPETFVRDPDVMALIDEMLIYALDLIRHPEHASRLAAPLPSRSGKVLMVFQIFRVARIANEDVPDRLERSAAEQKKRYREGGYLTSKSKRPGYYLARTTFVSTRRTLGAIYFT